MSERQVYHLMQDMVAETLHAQAYAALSSPALKRQLHIPDKIWKKLEPKLQEKINQMRQEIRAEEGKQKGSKRTGSQSSWSTSRKSRSRTSWTSRKRRSCEGDIRLLPFFLVLAGFGTGWLEEVFFSPQGVETAPHSDMTWLVFSGLLVGVLEPKTSKPAKTNHFRKPAKTGKCRGNKRIRVSVCFLSSWFWLVFS